MTTNANITSLLNQTAKSYLQEAEASILRNRGVLQAMLINTRAPLISKIRSTLVKLFPITPATLFCHPNTFKSLLEELDALQRFQTDPLTIDGCTITPMDTVPEGEFFFLPG